MGCEPNPGMSKPLVVTLRYSKVEASLQRAGLGGQGGQPDMGAMLQMLQNPGVQQAVQGMMAQPQLMQAMMQANPQMQAMMNQNPQMRFVILCILL